MKTFKLIALASVASLFVAACTKNAEVEIPTNDVNVITPATLEATTDAVKLSLNGLNPYWESGDSLVVFQYSYWKKTTDSTYYRDATPNVFKNTGGSSFTGGIANYKLKDVGGANNSYYAVYPAEAATHNLFYRMATTTSDLYVSPSQTGRLSDVGKHLTFKGKVTEYMDSTVSYKDNKITFLVPFQLSCCTPLIKFNVPEKLGLTKIVITASNDTTTAVRLSGKYTSRLDNGIKGWKKPAVDSIVIYRGGEQISGDVYIVLAPETNLGSGNLVSDIKTIKFALTHTKGWPANLKINELTSLPTAGNLKVLPTFPDTVNWVKPIGPGLATMSCSSAAEEASSKKDKKKIGLSPENPSSVIKYSTCSYSGDNTCIDTLSAPTLIYNDTDSIATNELVKKTGFPANFSKIQVETEDCLPYTCKAITWKLNSKVGFGEWFLATVPDSITAGKTTVSNFGLSFLYTTYSYESTKTTPQINTSCFYLYHGNTKAPYYCDGKISFVAPESGTATMYFNQTGLASGKKLIILNGSNTVSEGVALPAGNYKSSSFPVSKGDVITVYSTAKNALYSMTFLWVPDTHY